MQQKKDKEIFSILYVEDDEYKERWPELVKPYIGIEKGTGKVLLKPSTQNFPKKAKIMILLIGQYIAYLMEHYDKPILTTHEIVNLLHLGNRGKHMITPRLSELCRDGLIEQKGESQFQVIPARIVTFLESINTQ